jgi:hypothetical protein
MGFSTFQDIAPWTTSNCSRSVRILSLVRERFAGLSLPIFPLFNVEFCSSSAFHLFQPYCVVYGNAISGRSRWPKTRIVCIHRPTGDIIEGDRGIPLGHRASRGPNPGKQASTGLPEHKSSRLGSLFEPKSPVTSEMGWKTSWKTLALEDQRSSSNFPWYWGFAIRFVIPGDETCICMLLIRLREYASQCDITRILGLFACRELLGTRVYSVEGTMAPR